MTQCFQRAKQQPKANTVANMVRSVLHCFARSSSTPHGTAESFHFDAARRDDKAQVGPPSGNVS